MCDIMSNYMLTQSLVLILTQYGIKSLGNLEKCLKKLKSLQRTVAKVKNLHDANQL